MADINLLPDDLRSKETKERSSQKSFGVEPALVMPAKEDAKKKPSNWSQWLPGNKPTPAAKSTPSVSSALTPTKPLAKVEYKPVETPKPVTPTPEIKPTPAPPVVPKPTPPPEAQPTPVSVTKSTIKPSGTTVVPPKSLKQKKHRSWLPLFRRPVQTLTAGEQVTHNSSTLDVNLIPGELSRRPELELPRKLIISGVVIGICLVIIIAIYLGITWYQLQITRDIESLQTQIATLDAHIGQFERDKQDATLLQQQLQATRTLLDQHVYWTKFFDLLARNTAPDVYYTNFSMTGREKLVISAMAKDYKAIAAQLVILQNAKDFVRDVRIDAASAVIDKATGKFSGVTFTINLEFVPDIFYKPLE